MKRLQNFLLSGFPNNSIVYESKTNYLSSHDLSKRIAILTNKLKVDGVKLNDRVAIYLPRGVKSIIAIYAIILAGGVYVPLNMKDPETRILHIINDAKVKLIIGNGERADYLKQFSWLNIQTIIFNQENRENIKFSILKNNETPVVILYTSGSTGFPKGVVISHRALRSFVYWAGETFNVTTKDRIASLAPLTFDLSFFDIFTSLRFGASVYFISNELILSPRLLTLWLAEHEISIWYTVPSMLAFWALKGDLENIPLPKLRIILFAGEVLPTNLLIKLTQLLPNVEFYNLFGPTETNVCCYWKVDRKRLLPTMNIPIGIPACNSQLKINPANNELMMKGPNLMSGYWNGEECSLPVNDQGWYPTGDVARINELGEYLYAGRMDNMIKIFGYRVEPNEVEQALYNIPGVLECAVVGLKAHSGKSIIAACIATNGITLQYIKNNLKNYLPDYMVPSFFCIVNTLPRLANGKLDLIKIKSEAEHNYKLRTVRKLENI